MDEIKSKVSYSDIIMGRTRAHFNNVAPRQENPPPKTTVVLEPADIAAVPQRSRLSYTDIILGRR